MGWSWFLPTARYADPWRQGRKVLDRGLRPGAAVAYHPMQEARARVLLARMLGSPDEWEAHIELSVISHYGAVSRSLSDLQLCSLQGELILAMTYGYEVRGRNDRKIEVAIKMSNHGSATALPGALLVNNLPFRALSLLGMVLESTMTSLVRHIPEWLPWFSYKPLARIGRDLGTEVLNAPIQFVRDAIVS
jgi:hypothetical protein